MVSLFCTYFFNIQNFCLIKNKSLLGEILAACLTYETSALEGSTW